jgi:hypothetical protein
MFLTLQAQVARAHERACRHTDKLKFETFYPIKIVVRYENRFVTSRASLMFAAFRPVALSVCVCVLLLARTVHGARAARLAVETQPIASSAITWKATNATHTSSSLASWSTSGSEHLWLHNWLPQQTAAATPQPSHSAHQQPHDDVSNSQPAAPHKPLLPHMDKWDWILLAGAAVTLFIAAGGGIGGGAVFVPLYIWAGGKLTRTAASADAATNLQCASHHTA